MAIIFLLLFKQVSAQTPVEVADIDSGEEVYEMNFQTRDHWMIFSHHSLNNTNFIYSELGKFGPFSQIVGHYWDAVILRRPAGHSVFYKGKEYGPYDSIPNDGILYCDKKFLAFEIFENGSEYIVNAQTNERYGPFKNSYFETYAFSSDGKQLLFSKIWHNLKGDSSSMDLYQNSLFLKGGPDPLDLQRLGFDGEDRLYYHLKESDSESVYCKGSLKSYPKLQNWTEEYFFYFYSVTNKYDLKVCKFEKVGNNRTDFALIDSMYYLLSNQTFSGPFNYVKESVRHQLQGKMFSFVTLDKGGYYLHLGSKIFGPYQEKPEMEFNHCKDTSVKDKWAFKAKKGGRFFLITEEHTYGPFRYLNGPQFFAANGQLLYKVLNRSGRAFIHYGDKSFYCVSRAGKFVTSADGKYVVFAFRKRGKFFLGINNRRFNSVNVDEDFNIWRKFLSRTGEYVTLRKKNNLDCIYLNDKMTVCDTSIRSVGVSKGGELYYALKEKGQYYFHIKGKRLGPYDRICSPNDRCGGYYNYGNKTMIQAFRDDSSYLIFEDRVFGPFPERIYVEDIQFSKDSQRLVFTHGPPGWSSSLLSSEDPFQYINFIGDYELTSKGLCYYTKDYYDSIFFVLEDGQRVKLERGEYLSSALLYNWEYDILSYRLFRENWWGGLNMLRIKDKTYVGQFLRRSESELFFLDGNKLMYLKL